jgi:NAD+ synthetase
MITNYEKLTTLITKAMKEQAAAARTDKAEVDISGGVDSAVVAALACKAFGPENVIGVYSGINSSWESKLRARSVAEKFGFKMLELDLTNEFSSMVQKVANEFRRLGISWPDGKDPAVCGSFRSCLRAPVGRFVNRAFGGGIRQGTGNRDEDELLRFYQKGGDGEVDCNWVEGLFKSEIWELAEYLGVPQEIIDAKPTPDLWGTGDKHNDEDELKDITGVSLTYTRPNSSMGTIEWVIRENDKRGIIDGLLEFEPVDSLEYTSEQQDIVSAVRKMEKATRHKATLPPTLSREYLVGMKVVK